MTKMKIVLSVRQSLVAIRRTFDQRMLVSGFAVVDFPFVAVFIDNKQLRGALCLTSRAVFDSTGLVLYILFISIKNEDPNSICSSFSDDEYESRYSPSPEYPAACRRSRIIGAMGSFISQP